MILRKKRATRETAIGYSNDSGGDEVFYEITDHAPNPETHYAQTEEQRILTTAIQRLRPKLRVVVQTHLSAAKGRLFHAKKALRRSAIRKLVVEFLKRPIPTDSMG